MVKNRSLIIIGILCLLVLIAGAVIWPTPVTPQTLPQSVEIDLPMAEIAVTKDIPAPLTSAQHIFIMDRKSRMVLYQKNAEETVFPASTTKMMTALVALDAFPDLSTKLTVDQNYPSPLASKLFVAGQQLSAQELMYDMLIQSANDAAEVIAANYPGGRKAFIEAMNTKATQIHLINTHFGNPTGIDGPGHHSTAADLVRLADFALRNPEFEKIVGVENSVVSDKVIRNINELLGRVEGVKGVKTGYTEGAGQSLVTWVDRNGHEILMAVMGSADRFGDTQKLIEWTYKNYSWQDVTADMHRPGL